MNKLLLATLAIALPLALAGPAHADVVFYVSGHYYAASGVSYAALDACGSGVQEGLDSNCFGVPPHVVGSPYTLAIAGIGVTEPLACFYDMDLDYMSCSDATIPVGAAYVAVTSLTGVNVGWTFSVSR